MNLWDDPIKNGPPPLINGQGCLDQLQPMSQRMGKRDGLGNQEAEQPATANLRCGQNGQNFRIFTDHKQQVSSASICLKLKALTQAPAPCGHWTSLGTGLCTGFHEPPRHLAGKDAGYPWSRAHIKTVKLAFGLKGSLSTQFSVDFQN